MPTPTRAAISGERYLEVQASPEFQELRSRLRRFVFPMRAFFLIWYATYVLLGAFAHDFMATKVWGNINVGLIIGLGQFVSTFVITRLYVRFANRELDPRAGAIRNKLEGGEAYAMTTLHPGRRRTTVGNPVANIGIFSAVRRRHDDRRDPGQQEERHRRRVLHRRARHSPDRRTASRSPVTTCRRPASSASPGPSPSTATTASCTPSASWSPGWSRCCWWPNCCATQASSRWLTC